MQSLHSAACCAAAGLVSHAGADEMEYRLIGDVLRSYDPRVRPSLNASEPLNVTFGLALAQIIDVVSVALARSKLFT